MSFEIFEMINALISFIIARVFYIVGLEFGAGQGPYASNFLS